MDSMISSFQDQYNLHCSAVARYIDLVSEVGELGKEILSSTEYGKTTYSLTQETEEEMGDCLFSILSLCVEMGINPEAALNQALEKYRKRFKEKGRISSD